MESLSSLHSTSTPAYPYPEKKEIGFNSGKDPLQMSLRLSEEARKFSIILIPIDFSEESMRAFSFATALCDKFASKLILLHVIDPFLYSPEQPCNTQLPLPTREIMDQLNEVAVALLKPDQVYDMVVEVGRPLSKIIEVARKEEVDLIILTSHSKKCWKHFIYGSNVETIMRYAPCPYLTIPAL